MPKWGNAVPEVDLVAVVLEALTRLDVTLGQRFDVFEECLVRQRRRDCWFKVFVQSISAQTIAGFREDLADVYGTEIARTSTKELVTQVAVESALPGQQFPEFDESLLYVFEVSKHSSFGFLKRNLIGACGRENDPRGAVCGDGERNTLSATVVARLPNCFPDVALR